MEKTKQNPIAQTTEQSDKKQKKSAEVTQKESSSKKVQDSTQHATEGNKETSETNTAIETKINVGEGLSHEVQSQLLVIEGLGIKISEKKDKRLFLSEMSKPIPQAQRKLGKKPHLSPDKRKAARMAIKQLDLEIFNLEEDLRTSMGYLSKLTTNGRTSFDEKILRERAASNFYLSRNKNNIKRNIVGLINKVNSDSAQEVTPLVRLARSNGRQAVKEFQNMLLEFIRVKKHDLYVLCTGKETFKQEMVTTVRAALRSWNSRNGELSL